MKCILQLLSVLSVTLIVVVAIPADYHYGGGGGYSINGTERSFNYSSDSNDTAPPPDFGRLLPNLTQTLGGPSIFPGFGGGFFGNGQGGGFPFFG
ncbi:uncharacterized protein LOC126563404 [Anopheles maculipalpis]|uniref:uncharacterized protein LOC126563404 n=1 Tax=Anopheles maculipalpis TaxID=1496333 RepID=UPI002158ECB8|nr:uncharacterized protein LOC126563404 [Anopheles maculipalpis]